MENWGLITYRETCLLVDPDNTSTQRKQGIALYVAHEMAHQWFGNLVTMVCVFLFISNFFIVFLLQYYYSILFLWGPGMVDSFVVE